MPIEEKRNTVLSIVNGELRVTPAGLYIRGVPYADSANVAIDLLRKGWRCRIHASDSIIAEIRSRLS